MGTLTEVILIAVRVPDIGDFKDVAVIEVLVRVGGLVEEGQSLITLETDKAAIDIPSPRAGIVQDLKVAVNTTVSEGDTILMLEVAKAGETDEAPSLLQRSGVSNNAKPPAPVDTDPQPSALATAAKASEARALDAPAVPGSLIGPDATTALFYASPSVRRLARELGVPVAEVAGTGAKGRVTHEDVRCFVKQVMLEGRLARQPSAPAGTPSGFPDLLPWPEINFSRFGEIERRPLTRIRKLSSANLHRNWLRIPHVTNHDHCDITELEAFRTGLNAERSPDAPKLTMLAFVMKACVSALQAYPRFNASLDGDDLILKKYFHMGFAADTAEGLVVPVVRDADRKGVVAIARETRDLAALARAGKLKPSDMTGGCMSVSSLGGIGTTYFTPIINAPEVAILGVGRAYTQVGWHGGQAAPRLILPLSLSWDHRVIDGAEAARFLSSITRVLEDFRRAML